MDAIGLSASLFSLTGKAMAWLSELPLSSISMWAEMHKSFFGEIISYIKEVEAQGPYQQFQVNTCIVHRCNMGVIYYVPEEYSRS